MGSPPVLAERPSSTFVLLRDTVGTGYSTKDSPGRPITSLFPTITSSSAPNGKQGKKEGELGSAQEQPQEDQGLSRSSRVPAQGLAGRARPPHSLMAKLVKQSALSTRWSLPQYSLIYSNNFS